MCPLVCLQARLTASPPCSRSPWGLTGRMARPRPARPRGLALRMDHGSQYLPDHLTNQIKFWGIQPCYAFVAEPEIKVASADRFERTLKEQIIRGQHLPQHRGAAGRRTRLRRNSTMAQWIVVQERLPEPRSMLVSPRHVPALSIRPAECRQTCAPSNRVRYSASFMPMEVACRLGGSLWQCTPFLRHDMLGRGASCRSKLMLVSSLDMCHP